MAKKLPTQILVIVEQSTMGGTAGDKGYKGIKKKEKRTAVREGSLNILIGRDRSRALANTDGNTHRFSNYSKKLILEPNTTSHLTSKKEELSNLQSAVGLLVICYSDPKDPKKITYNFATCFRVQKNTYLSSHSNTLPHEETQHPATTFYWSPDIRVPNDLSSMMLCFTVILNIYYIQGERQSKRDLYSLCLCHMIHSSLP